MGSTNGSHEELMSRLVDSVKQISKLSNSKGFFGRIQGDLLRRITLLSPFFEELIDISVALNQEQLSGFEVLRIALDSSLDLFRSVNGGSKLLQIFHRGSVMQKFHGVTVEIEAALTQIPYDKFEVSEEVREQVQLLHFQFKRATERQEDYDLQLSHDLAMAESAVDPDPEILKRLSQELQLSTIDELKKESHAIHEYFLSYDGDPDDCFQRMSSLLKKLVDCATVESSEPDASTGSKSISRHRSPVIPEYFRCPISLELMKDPVIVSTGQTYERSSIQKWLDAGHKTCPKSQETLLHSGLTPNYVLKSLIALWCESNGIELPQNQGSHRTTRPGGGGGSSSSDCDRAFVLALLEKLDNGTTEQQRAAAGELRLLAKRNADNRVCIAEAGAIPRLVELLSSPDPRTQEHSVTALLNLSINEGNKGAIVDAGAITDIVEVLKNGSMEARENAAATLFSLSVVDENKVAIGAAGAIQALISLLEEGTRRGKKDAATAIFNLCIYQGNKSRAIKGGIVDPLTRLLKDAGGGMVDEALAILAILSTNQEGKGAIGEADTIPVLVEIIRTGSPRNRENAVAILWYLCIGNMERLNVAREVGADVALKELTENGTDRAKRKAASLLEIIQQLEGVVISTVP